MINYYDYELWLYSVFDMIWFDMIEAIRNGSKRLRAFTDKLF